MHAPNGHRMNTRKRIFGRHRQPVRKKVQEMADDCSGELWERQQGESVRAYRFFTVYRDMPYMEAANVTRSGRSAAKVAEATGAALYMIRSNMRRHDWTRRAAAYDLHMAAIVRNTMEAEIIKMHKAHAEAAVALVKKSVRRIVSLPDEDISARDAVRMLETGVKIERLSRGESSDVHRIEADVRQDTTMDVTARADLSRLSGEELDALERLCMKLETGDA